MSNTPIQDPAAEELSSGSDQTLPCPPLQPTSDPSASKRLCFYKSGDYKFSGHRMVINARTFKTFDALLDALSKKVPLPFGVRTITTPRGIHLVKGLDEFHDGGSYVCSDQKRVKPLNLAEVNRRQVPWNTTRPLSTGRRRRLQFGQFGRRKELANRPAKVTDRVTLRTPKRLVVIKNKDPTVKCTIMLQRRTAPTFDALLDYLSQILKFPVLKLFSTDSRRVDGLAALILCSGVVVAAGNEPFRLGNYSFNRTGQTAQALYMENLDPSMLQPSTHNNKSFSSGRGSRNFSLSSERYVINQINRSRDGSMNSLHHHNESFDTEVNQRGRGENEHHPCILPQDDDIEKSFRVNQDGSMTVEMKVRLTIKEEEMLHWTTTLSRHCLSKRTVCASISESANSSPDSNNGVAKDSSSISEGDSKEENHPNGAGKGVCFNDKHVYKNYNSKALGRVKTIKRTPTPGPRHVKKTASVESVKMVTESGIQESRLGHYSYMEKTADGETTEGYCVVRHSSSSSSRPIPKPRKTASAGKGNKGSHSSIRSSGVAEVLQIQNNGMEVTETVMHIYESQGCYDNYFANEEYSADGAPLHGSTSGPNSKPSTGPSGPRSSSNDCDIDFSRQPPTADSLRLREEMLSLSSEPISPTHEITNNLPTVTEDDAQTATDSRIEDTVKRDKTPKSEKNKKRTKPAVNHKSSTSKSSKNSTDKLSSNTSVGKKSLGSSESAKSGHKSKEAENKEEKLQSKKTIKVEKKPRKSSALLDKTENVKITPPKRQSMNKVAARDNGHNVNTPSGRPQMKKNISDILQPKKALLQSKKTMSKPKSMTENRMSSPKKSLEASESVSMPSLNPTPSEIHQYVENWLETVGQEQAPYTEAIPEDSEPPSTVVFQIGGGSESDEKDGHQNNSAEYYPLSGDNIKKSASCLMVPLYKGEPETSLLHSVSMPSVRVDPAHQDNQLRAHKSAEAIGPTGCESTSTTSNILTPKEKITPVLRQLCSSIQNIRRASDTNTTYNLEKSNSLPDFSTQVASVFGSSCKAFLSFLSVMTLRDDLTGSAPSVCDQSRSTSEAMLMMQSLMKISAIDDKEELRASLTNLQSSTSSQFRERWKDFQILRERLESEPLSPKVSETEFALDLDSEGGDIFEDQHLTLDELMEELNMPQDLRSEISSTIHQTRSFYPAEESTMVETEKNQSDSEEDLEKFVDESNDEAKSTDPDDTCVEENFAERKMDNDDGDRKSDQEADEVQEMGNDSEVSQTEQDEALKDEEDEDQVEEDREDEKAGEDGETNETNDDGKEEAAMEDVEGQKAEKGSVEESVEKEKEGTEEEMTADEEEEGEKLEEGGEEVVEETVEGLLDEDDPEEREYNSVEETEEREGLDETEEEERGGTDGVEEEADEEESWDEGKQEEEEKEEIEGQTVTEYDVEEELEKVIEETEEEEEVENIFDIEEEVDVVSEDSDEEADKVKEMKDEEEEVDNVTEVVDEEEEEEEVDNVTEQVDEEEEEEVEVVCRESNEEEGEDDDAEVERTEEERVITDESVEENEVQEFETEEEREDDKENEGSDQVEKQESKEEVEEEDVSEDTDNFEDDNGCKNLLEEASYLQQSSHEEANAECNSESPTKYSSEGQCEYAKGSGTDNELETDEGGERHEENSIGMIHPVEISQELLDFVNSALQSSSLTFSYDARGNIRIEPDYARVVQTMPTLFPNRRKDSSYGLKRLPSPNTSDLSDYRPDTSESGGYKTQESVDIVTESGEEASERSSPALTPENDLLSLASNAEVLQSSRIKSEESFSSNDSGTKASKEDLSYFSAASSLKADAEAAPEAAQPVSFSSEKDTGDGVLIDQGRWLLKENHLIRKSPPVALGMYGNMDSSSTDTGQENVGEDSPLHHKTQPNPLVDISSSELEDMAKPPTPKCTYYNMPHGSDSDPFLDNSSVHSVKRDTSSGMGRSFRVSPSIDTSKTRPNKIGSLSSFTSVEFRLPDGKIHPEGEAPAVAQPRRTSSGGGSALQAQNSPETLLVRCGQYCPIL
ncbi:oxygen-regulated protein 1 [Hippoglossus hippoglossus]|uniref:oxygen-regulated protein 1 n=1 Tax=Hippoglossus hippoglossus TaxID=8267 RepID=UPI00148CD352|nr:oxygen-regulated protein 1 [Hippoglossus hippoglossus]